MPWDAALTRRLRQSGGKIELDGLFTPTDTVLLQPENRDLVEYYVNFLSGDRALIPQGNVHFCAHPSERGRRLDLRTASPGDRNYLYAAG